MPERSDASDHLKSFGIGVFVVLIILPALAVLSGALVWLALTIWTSALSML